MKKKNIYKQKYLAMKASFNLEVSFRNLMHKKIVTSNKAYDVIFELIKPDDFKEVFAELYDLRQMKRDEELRQKIKKLKKKK